jgi:tetratricopeptide (TPR) repeat protein/transcriptional regulator with XRE-family HTH domain
MRGVREPDFPAVLRRRRIAARLTQEELAARAGLSTRSVSQLERGRVRHPRPESVRLLGNALGLAGSELDAFRALARAEYWAGRDHGAADQDGAGAGDGGGHEPAQPTFAGWPVPRQLPADVAAFTGRAAELAELDALLDGTAGRDRAGSDGYRPAEPGPAAVVIWAVSGTAGVGKTALAVHWAHRVAGRFPGGQLYVNLRGYDPDQPVAPADALTGFLTALGVAGQDIPVSLDERAARYRTETASRRLLIVLDNAASVDQVRPLLPGSASCAVVVTSRDSLPGLVAVHGARRLDLDLLPAGDALELLRRLIGARVAADQQAAAALAEQCVRLPLALRVAAELAAAQPATPLTDLIAELADLQQRLDRLDAGGDPKAAVRAVFSWSLQHLPADAAQAFRLAGLHPGPDLDPYALAALADTTAAHARRLLTALTRAHLLHPAGAGRYGMHDLLRAYATELSHTHHSEADRHAARTRLFDYYLATAAAAMDAYHPAEAHHRPRIPPAATPAPALPDPDAARAWLDTERTTLMAVAAHTTRHGWPHHTTRLASTLFRYLEAGHYADAFTFYTNARAAARRVGDPTGEAHALNGLGCTHGQLGHYQQAAEHLGAAIELFEQAGDRVGQARVMANLGQVEQMLGRHDAGRHLWEACQLYQQAGDHIGYARGMLSLGDVEARQGHYHQAADLYSQGLALFDTAGDRIGQADVLKGLGNVNRLLGRYRQAADYFRRALTLHQQLGNRTGAAWAQAGLGYVHTALGRPDEAVRQLQQALTAFHHTGDREGQACALNGLGDAATAAGRPTRALTQHTTALATATAIGDHDQQAAAHTGLARAHHALADPSRVRHHLQQALILYTDLGLPDAERIRAHLARGIPPPLTPDSPSGCRSA